MTFLFLLGKTNFRLATTLLTVFVKNINLIYILSDCHSISTLVLTRRTDETFIFKS